MHPFFFPLPPTFITSFWLRDSVCSDTHYCLISHVRYDLICNAQKRTRNRPESLVVLYFFSSIFSLLPYPSCVTNLLYFMSFICYPPFNLLITEGRHTMQNSILFSSSILNRQPQPNKKKRNLKTTSAPQSTPDAMPTGHVAIVLCECSCLFRADTLQGRNSFACHIYLLQSSIHFEVNTGHSVLMQVQTKTSHSLNTTQLRDRRRLARSVGWVIHNCRLAPHRPW